MFKVIFSLLLLGSSIGLFAAFISPRYDVIQATKISIDRYDMALVKTREIQELKRSLLSRFNIFSGPNIDRLEKLLPSHVDNVRLVLDIDGIASKYGIRIGNVDVETIDGETEVEDGSGTIMGAQKDGDYNSLILRFDVTATYENLISFMKDLESSLRITDLVSMEMSRVGGTSLDVESTDVESVYRMNFAIRTYWLSK